MGKASRRLHDSRAAQKILLTLVLLAVYRVGFQIPLPIVDHSKIDQPSRRQRRHRPTLLKQVAMFSASQLNQATIFGLGIMPYISASIIFQLLGSVYPPLEKLQKEGESGPKKINEYTRYATVVLCLGQSWFYVKSDRAAIWSYDSFVSIRRRAHPLLAGN